MVVASTSEYCAATNDDDGSVIRAGGKCPCSPAEAHAQIRVRFSACLPLFAATRFRYG
jgi:hypothetical protein